MRSCSCGASRTRRPAIVGRCRLNPDYAEVHNNLGNALMDLGQTDAAIESYRRAVELKPQLAEAHGSLGNAWLQARTAG